MTTSAATVRDVARLAGVSPGTVSKALNGRGQLREETVLRVKAAADELGFHPNHLARSLVAGRSFTVGVLTTDSFGRFTMPIMMGLEDALGAGQVSTLLCDVRADPVRERHYLRDLLSRRVDGLLVTGRRPDPRRSLGPLPIPVVYVLTQSEDPSDLSLTYDDLQGAGLAISHLVSLGRRRIAYVGGKPHHLSTRLRQQGAEAALANEGLRFAERGVLVGDWSEAWGRRAAGLLVDEDREQRVDGIFCASDQIARGVADGLRDAGIAIPEEIALVGFDNWEVMAEGSRPPLTTVDPNLTMLGQAAASRLLTAIDGGELPSGVILQGCDLVIRQSTVPN